MRVGVTAARLRDWLSPSRRDALAATSAGLIALAVYVRTLAPGLTDDVDTAMFQFVGRVLGVAHNPGYPLYVLLTFPFSFLPLGSLAYRINLFSALLGAVTVALTFLVARRLGCRRLVSFGAALGLAFGHVFWSQAVIAEVYTLNTAIVVGIFFALLTWRETRRSGSYFVAIALLAAGLGNHTTIVGFAPGMVLFVALTDARFVLRLRTMALTCGILAAGLLQYAFIIIRSNQLGAYVESRATSLSMLVDVMLGGQFRDRLFNFSWRALVFERVPSFVSGILAPELTTVGLVLAAAGMLWLLRRRLRDAILLLTGAGAIFVFALNYSVVDTPVFLIPTIVVLWLLAGVGAERGIVLVGRQPRISGAASLAMLGLPVWLAAHNFASTDRSRDTTAGIQLDRLFEALPDRAALVREDFLADRMVMAKLLGDGAARGRQIELTSPDAQVVREQFGHGVGVFAFRKSARRLRYDGMNVSFEPLRLMDGPLDSFLSRLADGSVVALAVPAEYASQFATTRGTSLDSIGGPPDLAAIVPSNLAIAGVRGADGAAVCVGRLGATLDLASGGPIGDSGTNAHSAIEVRSGPSDAVIRQGSRDIIRTSEGIAMAIWSPDGLLIDNFVLEARDGFQVPMSKSAFAVYPLRGVWTSQTVSADDWTDIAGSLTTGSLMLRAAADEAVVLYLSDDTPLAPRVVDSSERTKVDVASSKAIAGLTPSAPGEIDAATAATLDRDGHVYRIEVDAVGPGSVSVLIALGGVPAHALGRVVRGGSSSRADVFSVDTRGLLRTPDRGSEVLLMGRDDQAQLTGDGWSPVDWDAVGPYRWMTATEARLMLPLTRRATRRIRIQAFREASGAPRAVGLRLNGSELPRLPLKEGWHDYEWTVPPGTVSRGINEAAVLVDHLSAAQLATPLPREIAVAEVRLIHEEP